MRKLPLWQRPLFAKSILEVGGGHNPFAGVTHAVDKFPADNGQRGGAFVLPEGAKFSEGDIENLPVSGPFDFFYASHILEHVQDPKKAVAEINRVSAKGYIETPSPLREQLSCPLPFDAVNDFHTYFCWSGKNTLFVIRKSEKNIGEFCCEKNGKKVAALYQLQRNKGVDLEPMLPRPAKTSYLYFTGNLKLQEFTSFKEACEAGCCAYASSVKVLERTLSFPFFLRSGRFRKLRKFLP